MLRWDDLVICVAYFSIPIQIVVSLAQYPRLATLDIQVQIILILFALFIFLCGAGHLLRCMEQTGGVWYQAVNMATAIISLATSLYLVPLVPTALSALDKSLKELTSLNEELVQSKQQLITFMAFLCHEIRNPLFAITSSVTFLSDLLALQEGEQEDGKDAKQNQALPPPILQELLPELRDRSGVAVSRNAEAAQNPNALQMAGDIQDELRSIEQSSNLMLRLVNDVLDISKLESGKLELDIQSFDLHVLIQGVVSTMTTRITRRSGEPLPSRSIATNSAANAATNDASACDTSDSADYSQSPPIATPLVTFESCIDPSVPQNVQGDSVRVLQILYNLLSNAYKFTEEGSISFQVKRVGRPNSSGNGKLNENAHCDGEWNMPNKKDQENDQFRISDPHTQEQQHLFIDLEENKNSQMKVTTTRTRVNSQFHSETSPAGAMTVTHHMQLVPKHTKCDNCTCNYSKKKSVKKLDRVKKGECFRENNKEDANVIWVEFSVTDTGCGIPSNRIGHIFEPYAQSKLSDYRKHGGTGLGLSIVSRLVGIMGGTVTVVSTEGHGSQFNVQLPLTRQGQSFSGAEPMTQENIFQLNPVTDVQRQVKSPNPASPETVGLLASDCGTTAMPDNVESSTLSSSTNKPLFSSLSQQAQTPENMESSASFKPNQPLFSASSQQSQPSPMSTSIQQNNNATILSPNPKRQLSTAPDLMNSPAPSTLVNSGSNASTTSLTTPPPPPVSTPTMYSSKSSSGGRFKLSSTKKVLIVDDNAVNRKILSRMLGTFDLEFVTAENGLRAVEIMKQSMSLPPPPFGSDENDTTVIDPEKGERGNSLAAERYCKFGLILMDLSMPIMDGYEATRKIREFHPAIPIIALTACALEEGCEKALQAGATEFATKPILRDDLHKKCQRYLV